MKQLLRYLLLILIAYYFSSYLYENWVKIEGYRCETNWFYLSASLLLLSVTMLLLPISLKNIVGLFGYEISLKKITLILFSSQIAKYLPGGIWGYVGRVYLYNKEGMNVLDASKIVLLETLLVMISGFLVFVLSMFFSNASLLDEHFDIKYLRLAALALFVALLVIAHPKFLNYFMQILPERCKKAGLMFEYDYFALIKPLSYLTVFWVGIGISFWVLIKSFVNISPSIIPVITGAFVLSWIMGIIVFFTPGGLGIREVSLVVLLNVCLPAYIGAFIAVISRIWWIVGELIWLLISYAWKRGGSNIIKLQV